MLRYTTFIETIIFKFCAPAILECLLAVPKLPEQKTGEWPYSPGQNLEFVG